MLPQDFISWQLGILFFKINLFLIFFSTLRTGSWQILGYFSRQGHQLFIHHIAVSLFITGFLWCNLQIPHSSIFFVLKSYMMVFNKIVYKTDPYVPEVLLRSSDDSLYPNIVHAKPQSVTLHLPTFQVYLISSAIFLPVTYTRVFAISSRNSHTFFTIVGNLASSANFVCSCCHLGFHPLF